MKSIIKRLKREKAILEELSSIAKDNGEIQEARNLKHEARKLDELIFTLCTGC